MSQFSIDPPSQEYVAHHVGASGAPHMPPNSYEEGRDMPRKVQLLAQKLGLEWCVQCGDWHETAGGSEQVRAGMREQSTTAGQYRADSQGSSVPPGF